MFIPKYTITNKVLKSISLSQAAKELILSSFLIPAWELKLQKDARFETIYYNARLEGNKLSEDELREILSGEAMVDLDSQEILNLQSALDKIDQWSKEGTILSVETILELHKILTNGLIDQERQGNFRLNQIVVKDAKTGEVAYSPPPAVEVPFLIEDLLNFLNSEESSDTHPIIKGALAHFEIYRIHPFTHASNQLARLLSSLVLKLNGYDLAGYLSLEGYYDRTEDLYHLTLQSVAKQKVLDTSERDLTDWLSYYCSGFENSINTLKETVRKVSQESQAKDKLGESIILNERQIAIMEYLNKHTSMRNKDFRKIFPDFSDDTVLREMKFLKKHGLVVKEGNTKMATYKLAE